MLFVEFVFLPFFLTVFTVHWLLRSHRLRKWWLLAASYVFYGSWDWRFLTLLIFSTVLDYTVGLQLDRPDARRKLWLWVSLTGNLGLLGFFKYFNFFVDSAVDFLELLGFQPHQRTLEVLLPIGISFYTFQTLSYALDVYRGTLKATRSLLDFSLFVAFFPQLVAGPIVRASDFLPQLDTKKFFADVDVRRAAILFLIGFFKKACVSDTLAPFVDLYFGAPESYGALASWIAMICYAVQVYCDFSGYSDMAIACAWMFGYELTLNFDRPYLAQDLAEVWRRWHISLTTWLRDYVYIPLGGNRRGLLKTYRNLMITFLVAGVWHGAAWTFVLFGILHGLGLCTLRLRDDLVPWLKLPARFPLRTVLCVAFTFWFWCLTLILFRAQNVADAWVTIQSYVFFRSPGAEELPTRLFVLLALYAALHVLGYTHREQLTRAWRTAPHWAFSFGIGVVVAGMLWLVPAGARPFVYFQF